MAVSAALTLQMRDGPIVSSSVVVDKHVIERPDAKTWQNLTQNLAGGISCDM